MTEVNYPIGPDQPTRTPDWQCNVLADWTLTGRWTLPAGQLKFTWAVGPTGYAGSYLKVYNDRYYQIDLEIVSISSGEVRVMLGGDTVATITTVGTHTFFHKPTNDSHSGAWDGNNFYLWVPDLGPTDQIVYLDNIRVADLGDGLAYINNFFPEEYTFSGVVPASGNDLCYRLTNREGKTNILIKVDPDKF